MKNQWTAEQNNYLRDNYKSLTNAELCRNLGIASEGTLRSQLTRLELRRTVEDWWQMAEDGNLYARKMYDNMNRKHAPKKTAKTHSVKPHKLDNRENPKAIEIKPRGKMVKIGNNIWKEVH